MAEIGNGAGSSYPGALDVDNVKESTSTSARADVPNDLAACIVAVETELGTEPAGTLTDVKTFLQTEHETDGTHGTVTLPTGTAAAPSIGWTDTGFYEKSANAVGITLGGVHGWDIDTNVFGSTAAGKPLLLNEIGSSANPNIIPNASDYTTGFASISGALYAIVGGVVVATFNANGILLANAAGTGTPVKDTLYKDNIVKAHCYITALSSTPVASGDFNIGVITDNAVGNITVAWDVDFADINYAVIGGATYTGGSIIVSDNSKGTASVVCIIETLAGAATDANFHLIAIGNQ